MGNLKILLNPFLKGTEKKYLNLISAKNLDELHSKFHLRGTGLYPRWRLLLSSSPAILNDHGPLPAIKK